MARRTSVKEWLDRKAAAEHIGLTDWWLEKHAMTGTGPRYIRHGRKVWYRREDLDEWLENHENIAASGAGGAAGRNVLDDLAEWKRKREARKPDAEKLALVYQREYGEALTKKELKEELRKKLLRTFNSNQRELYLQIRACNG